MYFKTVERSVDLCLLLVLLHNGELTYLAWVQRANRGDQLCVIFCWWWWKAIKPKGYIAGLLFLAKECHVRGTLATRLMFLKNLLNVWSREVVTHEGMINCSILLTRKQKLQKCLLMQTQHFH